MPNGNVQPESNQGVIKIVVIAIALDGMLGVAALCYCLVSNTQPDATLLTAFVGLTSALIGYLGGMLSRTAPTTAIPASSIETKSSGAVTVPKQELKTHK